MGSCVSKKAARAGGAVARVAAPFPLEKEVALPSPLPPMVVEEEVKEVLSETAVSRPRPPEKENEVVKRKLEQDEEVSEGASVASAAAEKAKVKGLGEQEVEQRTVDGMEKGRARRRTPEQRKHKDAGNGRARSPSRVSAQRIQCAGEHPAPPRPRREHPAVVYGIGCRSGRFSPSVARKAADSAVRRTNSAREADMMLPHSSSRTPAAKRSLNATVNGNGNANGWDAVRRDPGERSGRRPDSPTSKRLPSPSPAANGSHRQAILGGGATRKATKENSTQLDQTKPQCGGRTPGEASDGTHKPALEATPEHKEAQEGALGQNPSVAMECFIFL
ncbi:hypothetical protein GUJ93_ZPchr0003g18252 [Zizania palustris]|uniref:Uncharacterized protein n=1 Tax=Zizania palustris TaxID=103762 RepID=A0A8J5V6S5_ZIZPA|nr:hypothetical protein GUJ93_ZPchr0003g18252 [Zizania palustris]